MFFFKNIFLYYLGHFLPLNKRGLLMYCETTILPGILLSSFLVSLNSFSSEILKTPSPAHD
jgi:hypothetical protein